MSGNGGEGCIRLTVDDELGAGAIAKLANIGDEVSAGLDNGCGTKRGVNDTNVGRVLGTWCRAGVWVEVRLARVVKGDVLLGYEAGANTSSEVLVEEASDFVWRDVSAAFKKALCEDGNCVCMSGDKLSEGLCEANLILKVSYGAALGGLLPVWE